MCGAAARTTPARAGRGTGCPSGQNGATLLVAVPRRWYLRDQTEHPSQRATERPSDPGGAGAGGGGGCGSDDLRAGAGRPVVCGCARCSRQRGDRSRPVSAAAHSLSRAVAWGQVPTSRFGRARGGGTSGRRPWVDSVSGRTVGFAVLAERLLRIGLQCPPNSRAVGNRSNVPGFIYQSAASGSHCRRIAFPFDYCRTWPAGGAAGERAPTPLLSLPSRSRLIVHLRNACRGGVGGDREGSGRWLAALPAPRVLFPRAAAARAQADAERHCGHGAAVIMLI